MPLTATGLHYIALSEPDGKGKFHRYWIEAWDDDGSPIVVYRGRR